MTKELLRQHIRHQVENGPFIESEHGAFEYGNRRHHKRGRRSTDRRSKRLTTAFLAGAAAVVVSDVIPGFDPTNWFEMLVRQLLA